MVKLVRALYGPTRGLLELDDAEADAAIKAGWAVDPFSTYEIAPDLDVAKATKAAEAAHAKRNKGEEAPKEAPKAKEEPKAEPEPEAKVESDEGSSYRTRVSKPKE